MGTPLIISITVILLLVLRWPPDAESVKTPPGATCDSDLAMRGCVNAAWSLRPGTPEAIAGEEPLDGITIRKGQLQIVQFVAFVVSAFVQQLPLNRER